MRIRLEDVITITPDGAENLTKWPGSRPGSWRWPEATLSCYCYCDMKTIAISIDEASLEAIDRLAQAAGRRQGGKRGGNRSEVVRRAVREFITRHRRHEREERDRRILGAHRERSEREAGALVAEQADL